MADYKSTHTGAEIDAGIDKAVTADTNWNLLMANLGIGRWANQTFITFWSDKQHIFEDDLSDKYSNITRHWAYSTWGDLDWVLNGKYTNNGQGITGYYAFQNTGIKGTLYLNTMLFKSSRLFFKHFQGTRILIQDGATVSWVEKGDASEMFGSCTNLIEIGSMDGSNIVGTGSIFQYCYSLKSIHIKHWKVGFNISASTAFEEADLVEIISNLDPVTTAQTLTMGTTNLAKLTDAEKQVATDKGWVLA